MNSSPAPTLLPHIQRLDGRLSQVLDAAGAVLPTFDDTQWNWSPDRKTWSAVRVCDHLNRVAELISPHLEYAVAQTRAAGHFSAAPARYTAMERLFIRILSPDPPFKVPVPSLYAPNPRDVPQEVGRRFLELYNRSLRELRESSGLDIRRVLIASPANRLIRLSAAAWFEAMVGHTEYHWLQVRALRAHPQFPIQR
jgi:hypothetical protein